MILEQSKRPLMGTDNILDLQNNGYKSTVSAIAEIVDNSIQAQAKNIDIILINDTNKHSDNINEIMIIDDGQGMDLNTFSKALMMNAGSRSSAKVGLGKYGQGLPNSSVSQTTRVEVYTFQNGKYLFDYIDLVEIYESKSPYLRDIEEIESVDLPFIINTAYKLSKSGTLVRWVEPNKVRPSTTWLLVENLKKVLGRIFRYYLNGFDDKGVFTKTSIHLKVYDYNGEMYSLNKALSTENILPFDPMFLMENTSLNADFRDWSHPTSTAFDTAKKTFEIEIKNQKNELEKVKTEIQLIFSHVKSKERFRNGPGQGRANKQFSEIYKRRNIIGTRGYENISIVRENREIDCGIYGFIEAIDREILRWWSVEIKVEPVLDGIIGIDNKKQQASNIFYLDAEHDDDSHPILKWISEMVKANIDSIQDIIANQYSVEQELNNSNDKGKTSSPPKLPPIGPTEPPSDDENDEKDPSEQDKIELFNWIKERYDDLTDDEINQRIEWAFSISDKYIFVYSNLGDTALYEYKVYGNKVLIEINRNHSFYKKFLIDLESDSSDKKIRSIRLLICSLVKSEISNKTENKDINRYMRKYRNEASIALDEYIDDLFNN